MVIDTDKYLSIQYDAWFIIQLFIVISTKSHSNEQSFLLHNGRNYFVPSKVSGNVTFPTAIWLCREHSMAAMNLRYSLQIESPN